MDFTWGQLFGAALGGGLTVKLLDILYQEYRKNKESSKSTEEFVDKHLDPLLKSADEFVGKFRSLAEKDFSAIRDTPPDENCLENIDFGGFIYLIGQFWAQIEIIRREGMSIAMSKDPRGEMLQNFFDCIESRRVRIVDRMLQRATAEIFITGKEVRSYTDFVKYYQENQTIRKWLLPLIVFLSRLEHTTERQHLLQYGSIIHAMIDSLDPKHSVTRERPSISHKLSQQSWRDLNYRVFGVYLKSVKNRQKYLGPPKKGGPKRVRQRKETLES